MGLYATILTSRCRLSLQGTEGLFPNGFRGSEKRRQTPSLSYGNSPHSFLCWFFQEASYGTMSREGQRSPPWGGSPTLRCVLAPALCPHHLGTHPHECLGRMQHLTPHYRPGHRGSETRRGLSKVKELGRLRTACEPGPGWPEAQALMGRGLPPHWLP